MNSVKHRTAPLADNQTNLHRSPRVLRLKDVIKKLNVSRSTVYTLVAENNLPKPISLGARSVGWLESSIDAWLEQQAEKANQGG